MNDEFPGAVAEIPASDVDHAAAYYKEHLGFTIDWGDEGGGGIGGAGFTNRVANGCDSCYVRGLLGDIRKSTSPLRDHKLERT